MVENLNVTIDVNPEMQNRRLETPDLARPCETRWLTGTGAGLARQQSAGWGFGQIWIQTDPFLRCKPGPPAGYPNPLLTLGSRGSDTAPITQQRRDYYLSYNYASDIKKLESSRLII
jgi:hypothetical protein